MAEDSDLEKTESASARRLEQAREEGQVPHSRELATFISLMVGVVALYVLGRWGGHRMMELVRSGLNFERQKAFEPEGMQQVLAQLATDGLLTIAPLLLASVVAALVTPFLMGGWVFSTSVLKFVYGLLPFCQRECWTTRGSIAHVYPASWLGVVARAMMSYPRVCS